MKDLSRRFQAWGFDPNGGRWEYRLLARPVYRYEPKGESPAFDGAIFLFCEGTDPEIVLGIEARRTETGTAWHYALASLSDWEIHVRLDDNHVWSDGRDTLHNPGSPHWSHVFEGVRLPEVLAPK